MARTQELRRTLQRPRWIRTARQWSGLAALLFTAACSGAVGTESPEDESTPQGPNQHGSSSEPIDADTSSPSTSGTSMASSMPGGQTPAAPSSQPGFNPQEEDTALSERDPDLFERAQQLFPGEGQLPNKRLFRLTVLQLQATAGVILQGLELPDLVQTMPADPLETNYAYSNNLSVNGANFAPYTKWASEVARRAVESPRAIVDCADDNPSCLRAESERWVRRAYRNTAPHERVQRLVDFFLGSVEEVGPSAAVGELVDVVLTSPAFLFRDEVAVDAAGALLAAQRLQQLTYTLADLPPEALGFELGAESEVFASNQALTLATDAVLGSDAARRKLVRFLLAWLEIDEPSGFNLAPTVFPEFTAEVASALETNIRGWIEGALSQAGSPLTAITAGDVEATAGPLRQLYSGESQGERYGVFTHPAFIASHSGPETTRLVKRGVFFVRKAMCVEMQLPPAGVETQIPEIPNVTERERVEAATSATECVGCHSFINPFGFMLERYDGMGRYRLEDEAGLVIDSSASFPFLEEVPARAESAVEVLPTLVNSDVFQQCFARQLFRYYVGRTETSADAPLLRQMWFAFVDGGQSLVKILGQLGSSQQLQYRKL